MNIREIPLIDRLNQLNEECGELIQASAKLIRTMKETGYTPVTKIEAKEHLIEEIADVSVCMTALQDIAPLARVGEIIAQKAQRWEDRINGKE